MRLPAIACALVGCVLLQGCIGTIASTIITAPIKSAGKAVDVIVIAPDAHAEPNHGAHPRGA